MTTTCPECSAPSVARFSHAVRKASGIAAACSKESWAGIGIAWVAGTRTLAAYPPPPSNAITRSPRWYRPAACSTWPEISRPMMSGSPGGGGYRPRRCSTSARFTPAARTRTIRSPSRGWGSGTSASFRTSGPPGRFTTMARMGDSYYEGLPHARPPDRRRPPARIDLPAASEAHRLAGAERYAERARPRGRRPSRRAHAILRGAGVGRPRRRYEGRGRGRDRAAAPGPDPGKPGGEFASSSRAASAARPAGLRLVPQDGGGRDRASRPPGEDPRGGRARASAARVRGAAGSGGGAGGQRALRAFVPIWMDPLMTINGQTFMNDALRLGGGENVFADRQRMYPLAADLGQAVPRPAGTRDTRYPRISLDEVVQRAPEIVLLPDEPHPFSEEDPPAFRAALPHGTKVVRCGGRDFSWYGAQSIEGGTRLRALVDSLPCSAPFWSLRCSRRRP